MAWVKILKPDYILGHGVGATTFVSLPEEQLQILLGYGAIEKAKSPDEGTGAYPESFPENLRAVLEEAGYASLDEVRDSNPVALRLAFTPQPGASPAVALRASPAVATTPVTPITPPPPYPEGFDDGARKLLEGAGYATLQEAREASDETLLEIKGVGPQTLTVIRALED